MEDRSIDYSDMGQGKNDFLASDFDHSDIDHASIKTDLDYVKGLAHERDLAMLSRDIGDGRQLGNSKTVLKHVREAAKRIRTMADSSGKDAGLYKGSMTPEQQRGLKGEAQGILRRAFMEARAEFIRRSGMSLDGY